MQPILAHALAAHTYLREQILAECADIDDETLRETLQRLTSLSEALAAVVRAYLDDVTLAAALGTRIADMQARLGRIEARAEKKRATITRVMERADLKKLAEPDFTVSLRATPRQLVVQDEAQIPQCYWTPQPPKLDRRQLLAALAGDSAVPGASLSNGGMTISVRTK